MERLSLARETPGEKGKQRLLAAEGGDHSVLKVNSRKHNPVSIKFQFSFAGNNEIEGLSQDPILVSVLNHDSQELHLFIALA